MPVGGPAPAGGTAGVAHSPAPQGEYTTADGPEGPPVLRLLFRKNRPVAQSLKAHGRLTLKLAGAGKQEYAVRRKARGPRGQAVRRHAERQTSVACHPAL